MYTNCIYYFYQQQMLRLQKHVYVLCENRNVFWLAC